MIRPPNTISSRFEIALVGDAQAQHAVEEAHASFRTIGSSDDEGRAQKRAQDRADAADDDHEQDAERQVEVVGFRLDRAEIGVRDTARRRRRNRTS